MVKNVDQCFVLRDIEFPVRGGKNLKRENYHIGRLWLQLITTHINVFTDVFKKRPLVTALVTTEDREDVRWNHLCLCLKQVIISDRAAPLNYFISSQVSMWLNGKDATSPAQTCNAPAQLASQCGHNAGDSGFFTPRNFAFFWLHGPQQCS